MPDEKLARAIRSQVRRNILKELLARKDVSVHAFAEKYGISESCASKHFGLLYDLGFLGFIEKPPEKLYTLKIKEVRALLEAYGKVVQRLKRG